MITTRDHIDFISTIKPPSGYKLEYCIGTSYSLEIPCLIQLALTACNRGSVEDLSVFEALSALEEFQNRSVVFVQNCNIKNVPRSILDPGKNQRHRLFLLLDQMIATVPLLNPYQSFHPKVWLLRYDSLSSKPPIFKLVVMSRNISSSKQWDISVSLFGSFGKQCSLTPPLRAFLNKLLSGSSIQKGSSNHKLLVRAISDLSKVHFEVPKGTQKADFQFQWLNEKGFTFDPSDYERVIVISPFVGVNQIKQIGQNTKLCLVTTSNQLQPLLPVRDLIGRAFSFRMEDFDLHAKVYVGLRSDRGGTDIFLGSANCTSQGLAGINAEAMVRLKAASNWFHRFEENFIYENKKHSLAHPWLHAVDWKEVESFPPESDPEDQVRVEQVKCKLSTLDFSLHYDRRSKNITISLSGWTFGKLDKNVKGSVLVAGSTTSFDLQKILSGPVTKSWTRQGVPSQFLLIELKSGNVSDVFCTIAKSNIPRASRLRSGMSEFIVDSDSFFEYLTSLLHDYNFHNVGQAFPIEFRNKRALRRKKTPSFGMAVLESLLVAVARNPQMLARVKSAMDVLEEKGHSLDSMSDFRQVFEDVAEAATKVEKRYGKKILSAA